jgi:hypothetical protein
MPEIITELEEKLEALECTFTPGPPPAYCLRLPFGIEICTGRAKALDFEGLEDQLLRFVGMLQPLLTPLMLILILASLVKLLIDCVKSVADAVSSLSPKPIYDCLDKIARMLPVLMHLIPPLNYIRTIIDVVRIVVALMDALIESIILTIEKATRVLQFQTDVDILPDLGRYRNCIDLEIDAQYQQLAAALRTSGPLFKVLAQFLELLELPGLDTFITPLREAAETLAGIQADQMGSDSEVGALLVDLRNIRVVLGDLERALAPFGGSGEDFQSDD